MLTGFNIPGKEFMDENKEYAGDRVADTPPGCDDDPDFAVFYPSASSIAGCLDNDPNTPCRNGCFDADPNTLCEHGCSFDFSNCTYTGTYRDYNYDPIQDPNNILARNHMSYTGACRQEFTPGQIARADQIFNFYWKDYYEPLACGSLEDKVEIEDTPTGLGRVFIKVFNQPSGANFTRTVTNPQGEYYGQLADYVQPNDVTADVKMLGSEPDFGFTKQEWKASVSTFDLLKIKEFLLGNFDLSGYRQIAADANRSGSVTTFDMVELRKLILDIIDKLPNYDQPWVFIPEWVTLVSPTGNNLHPDFDGLDGDDNPFDMTANGVNLIGAPYINSDWPFKMRKGWSKNGFDAVKLGNVFGPYPTSLQSDDCLEEDIVLVMPNASLPTNQEFELVLSGHNFTNVAAFQLGLTAAKDDFEFISAESTVLEDFGTEISVGGLNIEGKEGLKTLWLSPSVTPKSVANGTNLMKFRLRTKNAIPNLQDAIELDKTEFKNGFWTIIGDCLDNISIQATINLLGGERSAESANESTNESTIAVSDKLICVPNPANDAVRVVYDTDRDFSGIIHFYDMKGSLLLAKNHEFQAGRNMVEVTEISEFPKGVINITVKGDRFNHVARLVKL
jgi:hypothetical protein